MVVLNTIDFINISTLGSSITFGTLTVARETGIGNCSNTTRGVFGGGFTTINIKTTDSIEIPVLSNATSFGELTQARRPGSCSDSHGGLQ